MTKTIEKWEPLIFDMHDKKNPRYYVSSFGRIKAYTHVTKGNILKGSLLNGYPCFDVKCYDSNRKRLPNRMLFVHKVVAQFFIKNPGKKKKVIHLDYNRKNNHPSNLAWATYQEALIHNQKNPKYQKKFGHNRRLTNRDVDFIRVLFDCGVSVKVIAEYYGYSEMQISRIKSYKYWKEKI